MILMALDHVRDFFGSRTDPTNVTTTTAALFFTRWITHVCAPTFFLLAGTGAALSLGRKSTAELSRFLVTRGVWLIFLELVVVRCLGLQFNFDYRITILEVLWALGWAMIALGGFVWLPRKAIAAISLAMIVGHNLLDGVRSPNPWWVFLHRAGIPDSPAGTRGVRRLPDRPVDRRHGHRFRPGRDLRLEAGAAAGLSATHGHRPPVRVRRAAVRQRLRRCVSLVGAADGLRTR